MSLSSKDVDSLSVAEKRAVLETLLRQKKALASRQEPALKPRPHGADAPLSFAQERLWFLEKLHPGSQAYHMPLALQLEGNVRVPALEQALTLIVERHEALRTGFIEKNGQAQQVVHPAVRIRVPLIEVKAKTEDWQSEVKRQLTQQSAPLFSLGDPSLMRLALLAIGGEKHFLLVTWHHLVTDGWSIGTFIQELRENYRALSRGEIPRLAPQELQYADFAVWQREMLSAGILDSQLSFWRARLEGAPHVVDLTTDFPRPAIQGGRGAIEGLTVSQDVLQSYTRLAQREGVTLFMLLQAGIRALLLRHTGQKDILLGTPIAGRSRPQLEPLIGLFLNTLVLRAPCAANTRFSALLGAVREATLDAFSHQDLPFERLVEELQPERDMSRSPLVQVSFALQNMPRSDAGEGIRALELGLDEIGTKYDLSWVAWEAPDGLRLGAEYDRALFDRATIRRMLEQLCVLLTSAVASPELMVQDLRLLPEAELQRILLGLNANSRNQGHSQPLAVEMFSTQAQAAPHATAVEDQSQQITYAELDRRSNQLARSLVAQGAGPDRLVVLCLDRGIDLVVAIWAVLKSGSAYVPLDPTYPVERIGYMVDDSGAEIIITQHRHVSLFSGRAVLALDDDLRWRNESTEAPTPRVKGENVAYVIYTSGSTGRPKGVMVQHRNLASFIAAMDEHLAAEAQSAWLAVTSVSFDIAGLELLWTLTRGLKVVVQRATPTGQTAKRAGQTAKRALSFSLFYFANDEDGATDKYRLLLEGARFADEHGFEAVWTPERHFHAFGGTYPNPSVVSAALAVTTKRIRIRAGSVVLPLQEPLRVAEEWSVVDNLSGGRVDISFASGWAPNDFVFAPEKYADRRAVLYRGLEEVKTLWRGGAVQRKNPKGEEVDVRIRPKPVQAELNVWITSSGSVETFEKAGALGANVLTHLLSQSWSALTDAIAAYRRARAKAGWAGPGRVTVMVHTLLGRSLEEVRQHAREPLLNYLRTHIELFKQLVTFVGEPPASLSTQKEIEQVLPIVVDRYFELTGLFGTPDDCQPLIERLMAAGVDEAGCLIDYGVPVDIALDGLVFLDGLRRQVAQSVVNEEYSVGKQLSRQTITHLQCTPSFARTLLDEEQARQGLSRLKWMLVGGEALPRDLADELKATVGGDVLNMYGPTETTIWSSVHRVKGGELSVPIGMPLGNTQLCVLDHRRRPVPVGVPGELYIGGEGVARGYWRRPELTAERFVPNEYSGIPGSRLYRTGDRVRLLSTGEIEFLGRLDYQVKLRGFRIELGEIEAALLRCPGVSEAVAAIRGEGADKLLVGYVVAERGSPLDSAKLQENLRQQLPEYMVPQAIVTLPALPLTPNGKVDRKALPAPDFAARVQAAAAPRTPLEDLLVQIFADLLQLPTVGIRDGFFELGGHSLLAARASTRLTEAVGVEVPVRIFFERPTVEQLAEWLQVALAGGEKSERPPLVPAPRMPLPPLSFAQERLWLLEQIDGQSAYNVSSVLRLRGALDVEALRRALEGLLSRHEPLRTTVEVENGRPYQKIHPPSSLALVVEPMSGDDMAARWQEAERIAREEALLPFDFAAGPIIRFRLLRVAQDDHVLSLAHHHIASDGVSRAILARDLTELYGAQIEKRAPQLPPLPFQYADFAVWQRSWLTGAVLDRQVTHWRTRLEGAPVALELPTDRPRPATQGFRGGWLRFSLESSLSQQLREVTKSSFAATPFMMLLGVWQLLLARWAGQLDVVVGTPVTERPHSALEETIGFYINTLPMRVRLGGHPTFAALISRVKEATLDALSYRDVSFEKLVEELKPPRDQSRSPIFQVLFNLQNQTAPSLGLKNISLEPVSVDVEVAQFDLTLSAFDDGQQWQLILNYNSDLFERATVDRMARQLRVLLEAGLAAPETPAFDLPLLSKADLQEVLRPLRGPVLELPPVWVPELLSAQVARTPESTAVSCGERSISYADLERRSNQMARALMRRGAGTGSLVGVCLERGIDMVVALCAVLKSGSAYVPLDPAYPIERIRYMVEDSKARVVLTQQQLMPHFEGHSSCLAIDADTQWKTEVADPVAADIQGKDVAYVIYTSGSTGRPKGVMVEHRNLRNFQLAMDLQLDAPPGSVWLAVTSISFDISALELFWSLCRGLKVVMLEEQGTAASAAALLTRHAPTHLQCTPSFARTLLEDEEAREGLAKLKWMLVGGEALPSELADRLKALVRGNVLNMYGPTETTIWSSSHAVKGGEAVVPIGSPLGNTQLYVLDDRRRPVPVGVPGELYIGGDGVVRGYLHRPDLTAERFVPDEYSGVPGARLYRTGDRIRLLATGEVEFQGRWDYQVKLRGFRIELGEVEAALRRCPGVSEAVASIRGEGAEALLVAYVVPQSPESVDRAGRPRELRQLLSEQLPQYMVPSSIFWLDALPRTPNGKTDRAALSKLKVETSADAFQAPRSHVEEEIALLWADALKVQRVGVNDNFFELGGHSLLLASLGGQLQRAFGVQVRLADLFRAPTLAAQAELIALRLSTLRAARQADTTGYLQAIRREGVGSPLFCFHPYSGEALMFVHLERYLRSRMPVYGFEAPERHGGPGLKTIAERANLFLEDILRLDSKGPYRLLGFSYGGLVAFEIARVLLGRGRQVEFLGLLDTRVIFETTTVPSAFRDGGMDDQLALDAFVEEHLQADIKATYRSLDREGARALALSHARMLGALEVDASAEAVMGLVRTTAAVRESMASYRPSPLPSRIDLFFSEETLHLRPNILAETSTIIAGGEVVMHAIPGAHTRIMSHPHIVTVAREIDGCFAKPGSSS